MTISTKILDKLLPDRTTWDGENRQFQLIVAAVVIWDVAAVKEHQQLCVCASVTLCCYLPRNTGLLNYS